jgi:hypothetical protein
MRRFGKLSVVVPLLGIAGAASASTVDIGPGANVAGANQQDTYGAKTFVDITDQMTLPAGAYTASEFNYNANGADPNDLQPFLAIVAPGYTANGSNTDGFDVIAAGSDSQSLAGINSVPFGGTQSTFTVPSGGETVYAGFLTLNSQFSVDPIYFNVEGADDSSSPSSPSTVNDSSMVNNFNNPGLGREYAFSITVTSIVPEPASLGLLAIGGLAALSRRRRGT